MSTEATNREAAVALAEALGNLPLALEQAAAYAGRAGISLADYLALFRERVAAYVPPAPKSADYPDALAVTFEIAFERLREESPAAADLLTACAFLAPDDVPLEIFKTEALAEVLPDVPATAEMLQAYALAKVRGGSLLSMHRLTQAIARDRLGDEDRKGWAEVAVKLLRGAFLFDPRDTKTWPPSARLLQHSLTAAEHARASDAADEHTAVLLNNVGLYLLNSAEYPEARAAFDKSAELCEKLYGADNPEMAVRLNNIGETLRVQGNLDEAADYLKRALAIDEAALKPDHPNVAIRLNNIGNVLHEKGSYAEAREHYERALPIFESVFGPTHANVATLINNIGMTLEAQADHKGACEYYERALRIDEGALGPDQPDVAVDLNNLATSLANLGEFEVARGHLKRALRIFREHFGESHPSTSNVKRNLERLEERAAGEPPSGEGATAAAAVETSEDEDEAR